ncbi:MAG TPA: hypothetical protein VKY33_05420 [Flavobacterium sp.]|nr:hypothetical protein [Flavobacterium sp.]
MNTAFFMQKFQDWFTQQWVILFGKRITPTQVPWLFGPFGELGGIGENFLTQLAEKENLTLKRNLKKKGLLKSIETLHLPKKDLSKLSKSIVDFYEHTSDYKLEFSIKWSPMFYFFGLLTNRLFTKRINQLNIPIHNIDKSEKISNEIIQLTDPKTDKVKYTIWLRKLESSGKVIYSGIYTTCKLPTGTTCIKAIFPLPKGNATVLMKPSVGKNNELILDSSGKTIGDAGFYFLLEDSKGIFWTKFVSTFKDKLIIKESAECLSAKQTLKLWNLNVAVLNYKIEK